MEGSLLVNLSFDVPVDDEARKTMNVIQAIAHSKSIVLNAAAPAQDRALHLSWLFHMVGDLHQPMHSTALFSQGLFSSLTEGDRGGNRVLTTQRGNLHSLWDGFPGGKIKFNTAVNRANEIVNDSALSDLGVAAAAQMNPTVWMDESHALAKELA